MVFAQWMGLSQFSNDKTWRIGTDADAKEKIFVNPSVQFTVASLEQRAMQYMFGRGIHRLLLRRF